MYNDVRCEGVNNQHAIMTGGLTQQKGFWDRSQAKDNPNFLRAERGCVMKFCEDVI